VPLVAANGGYEGRFLGEPVRAQRGEALEALEKKIAATGYYAWRCTEDEEREVADDAAKRDALFTRLIVERVEQWMALAEERLQPGGTPCFVNAGNDDPPEIDDLLADAGLLRNVQGRVTQLRPGIVMASRGESTPTPWNTPRELSEDDLGIAVREVLDGLPEEGVTIWNLHMPPHATSIDGAPRLDAQLRVQYDGAGEPIMVPVGSTAIRELVTERQPTIALHGHIHEGRGRYKIGRTTGLNPGSQYQDGVLLGVLLRVSARQGLRDFAFTAG